VKSRNSILAVAILLGCCNVSAAQRQAQLRNVGRLCNAFVYANGVNGGDDQDNPFYGARNAFDDGQNVVRGIQYSSWQSGKKADWIRIRFAEYTGPLSVEAITVRTDALDYAVDTMQITIGFEGGQQQQLPVVKMTPPFTTYPLPPPAKDVSFVRLDFQAVKAIFKIEEIQILGQPSQYCHATESTPYFDSEYRSQLIIAKRPPDTAEGVLHDPQITAVMKKMAAFKAQVDSAQSEQARSEAWLNLNREADVLALRLSEILRLPTDSAPASPTAGALRIAEKAKALGIPVTFCEIGEGWNADTTGYQKYLQLWPAGPHADEAFWKSEVEQRCGDFEPSVEEYEAAIKLYRGFMERFPASSYVPEAKAQIVALEKGLEEERRRPPAGRWRGEIGKDQCFPVVAQ
jgi:hypothetical protein